MLLNDDLNNVDIEDNNICSCYDVINKKYYKEYIYDFINYTFINNTQYKLKFYIYDSISNIPSSNYNKLVESKLSYYKNDTNIFYLEFINDINFNCEKGVFKFDIFNNNKQYKSITFNYKLNEYNYKSDIMKLLFNDYHIYLYLQKNKFDKLYISKILFHFSN